MVHSRMRSHIVTCFKRFLLLSMPALKLNMIELMNLEVVKKVEKWNMKIGFFPSHTLFLFLVSLWTQQIEFNLLNYLPSGRYEQDIISFTGELSRLIDAAANNNSMKFSLRSFSKWNIYTFIARCFLILTRMNNIMCTISTHRRSSLSHRKKIINCRNFPQVFHFDCAPRLCAE